MDEYVDELLNLDACLDIVLTRIPKRTVNKRKKIIYFIKYEFRHSKKMELLNLESVLWKKI